VWLVVGRRLTSAEQCLCLCILSAILLGILYLFFGKSKVKLLAVCPRRTGGEC
jgi:hypothetical protein